MFGTSINKSVQFDQREFIVENLIYLLLTPDNSEWLQHTKFFVRSSVKTKWINELMWCCVWSYVLSVSYITANLYCICLSTCFMLTKADAVQICRYCKGFLTYCHRYKYQSWQINFIFSNHEFGPSTILAALWVWPN